MPLFNGYVAVDWSSKARLAAWQRQRLDRRLR